MLINPNVHLEITDKELPKLRHKTAGDTCEIEIKGVIKTVTRSGNSNVFMIEVKSADYIDKSDQDADAKSAYQKAKETKYVKLESRPVSY